MVSRRQSLTFLTGAMLLAGCASPPAKPRTYVLVHGAWHGGWEWEKVVPLLESAGARVFAPTLKGLAERQNENGPDVTLTTHIEEIVALLNNHQLDDVILVGHSYAGFVITGVCDRSAERIGQVVYLDAFVPSDGQKLYDLVQPAARVENMRKEVVEKGQGYKSLPPNAAIWGLSGQLADEVNRRMTPQPANTFDERITLQRGGPYAVPKRTYIGCQQPAMPAFIEVKARVRADPRWRFVPLAAGHEVGLTHPGLLATTLGDL